MKIHERLKSKAVDIHIQKMASLTLNGAPLRAATNQYRREGENARERARCRVYARGSARRHCATLLLGMRRQALIDRSRLSFRVVSFGKGVRLYDCTMTSRHSSFLTPRCGAEQAACRVSSVS